MWQVLLECCSLVCLLEVLFLLELMHRRARAHAHARVGFLPVGKWGGLAMGACSDRR